VLSLRATTFAIGNGWVDGEISGTYARTALDQTFLLIEKERASIAGTPDDLANPHANALARDGEQLARIIAALSSDIAGRDGASARRHLADLQTSTAEHP
jgi:hypothetical protein